MDDGDQSINDESEIAQIKRQANKVMIQSLLFAALFTLIFVLIPL